MPYACLLPNASLFSYKAVIAPQNLRNKNDTLYKLYSGVSVLLLSFSAFAYEEARHQNRLNLNEMATDFITLEQQTRVNRLGRQGYSESDALKIVLKADAGREIDKRWEEVQEADRYKREKYFRTTPRN